MMEIEITADVVRSIADFAGIAVPDEDLASLAAVMTNQVAMVELLRPMDFRDVPPIVSLDPRWT
jgi:hypothetical protein